MLKTSVVEKACYEISALTSVASDKYVTKINVTQCTATYYI